MKTTVRLLLAAGAALAAGVSLSGCATPAEKQAAKDPFEQQFNAFGRSVRQNIAAQIADPDPAWKNTPPPATNGRRVEEAQKTYHKEQAQTSTTTSFSLGGP